MSLHRPAKSILTYLRAKDGNRPHLMTQAFTSDAVLLMDVKAGSISFPPLSRGREAISEVLVRKFAQSYENVYTLCLSLPPRNDDPGFVCDWLVAMSEKETGAVRVGCGRYDWSFAPDSKLVDRLSITIEAMQMLPAHTLHTMTSWIANLPYPWCPTDMAMVSAPKLRQLDPVREYLERQSA